MLLATLGLRFMHQRPDRNEFVTVTPNTGDLATIPSPAPQTFGLPYDYDSAMSVGAVDGNIISTIGGDAIPSDTIDLSQLDKAVMLQLYSDASCPVETPCKGWCMNEGTCFPVTTGDPFCQCPDGATGDRCETVTVTFNCEVDSCLNGGSCVEGEGDLFTCICPENFIGDTCETPVAPDVWLSHGDYEYMESETRMGWYNALVYCKNHNAHLARYCIRDPVLFSALAGTLDETKHWVDLSAKPGKDFLYGDLIAASKTWTPWSSTEPLQGEKKQCAALLPLTLSSSRRLKAKNCNSEYYALCERLTVNHAVTGFAPGNGKSYFLTPSPTSGFSGAELQCSEHKGAHLAVLAILQIAASNTGDLGTVVDTLFPSAPSETTSELYVGFEDVDSVRTFKALYTLDTTTINAGNHRWGPGEPSTTGGQQCTAAANGLNGKIMDLPCNDGTKLHYGLCEVAEFTGDADSTCQNSGNSCPNGKCVIENTTRKEVCVCNAGFAKDENGVCAAFNECLMEPCGAGATCIEGPPYTCDCGITTLVTEPRPHCSSLTR